MPWYPASFELFDVSKHDDSKAPLCVFGPDLHEKIKGLKEFSNLNLSGLQVNTIHPILPDSFEITINGTRYCSIGTSKFNRNLPKSGVSHMKPICDYIQSSQKSFSIDDSKVDRDLIHVICNKSDLVPIATQIARTFPLYCTKTAFSQHRFFKLKFTSVDDLEADKSGLITLMDNVRRAARIGDMPPNLMHCTEFLKEAQTVVKDLNNEKVEMKVIRGNDLEKQSFGGIWSVGMAAVMDIYSK